ncbi:type 1 fimbrial protein subunit FimA [Rosenbergiella sp. S61]|uniref:Type 1 fimbrial protein subunit FimA n=1 Tax=Rosenbergiella gaditana TaxID=2726987 RepID=A0ABS5SXS2_9GAMM|nr:type 1 fimbrial major subunit FimA [Rosenbergiella gaditana]MBT0724707.1 type 1 fimbrial protein subunit FimA [Rosenbergiella gaditana]
MKLNKLVLLLSTAMTLSIGTAFAADDGGDTPAPAPAPSTKVVNGGTVHFTGSLVDAACVVSTKSADQTVELGQYTLNHFKKVGDKSATVPFQIQLEDCDTSVATTAAIAFTGQQDTTSSDLLAINSAGDNANTASGVGIQILDETSKVLPIDGSKFSAAHTIIDGSNTLQFAAQYVSTSAKPTAGQADADAMFVLQYQ